MELDGSGSGNTDFLCVTSYYGLVGLVSFDWKFLLNVLYFHVIYVVFVILDW